MEPTWRCGTKKYHCSIIRSTRQSTSQRKMASDDTRRTEKERLNLSQKTSNFDQLSSVYSENILHQKRFCRSLDVAIALTPSIALSNEPISVLNVNHTPPPPQTGRVPLSNFSQRAGDRRNLQYSNLRRTQWMAVKPLAIEQSYSFCPCPRMNKLMNEPRSNNMCGRPAAWPPLWRRPCEVIRRQQMLSVRPILHCTSNAKSKKAPTNCWVVRTLLNLSFVLEQLGFCMKPNAV